MLPVYLTEMVQSMLGLPRQRFGYVRRASHYYDAVLPMVFDNHRSTLYFRHRQTGCSKLELTGVGKKDLEEVFSEVLQICEVDPQSIEIMRVDLAADIYDFSVEWFRKHTRVRQKRSSREFLTLQSERGQVQTLYFGKRPNLIRIYDKLQQLHVEYRKSRRNGHLLTFEETYGYPESGLTLTRVERQCGGGKVPDQIRTLGLLRLNGLTFNPFDPLEFLPFTLSDESISDLKGDAFLRAHGTLRLLENRGYHETKRLLDTKSSRNSSRLLKQFRSGSGENESLPDLLGAYQNMLGWQVAA